MEQRDGIEQLIEPTLGVWQPRTALQLTREDARQLVENVTGFFRLLRAWDAEVHGKAAATALNKAPGDDQAVGDLA